MLLGIYEGSNFSGLGKNTKNWGLRNCYKSIRCLLSVLHRSHIEDAGQGETSSNSLNYDAYDKLSNPDIWFCPTVYKISLSHAN